VPIADDQVIRRGLRVQGRKREQGKGEKGKVKEFWHDGRL